MMPACSASAKHEMQPHRVGEGRMVTVLGDEPLLRELRSEHDDAPELLDFRRRARGGATAWQK